MFAQLKAWFNPPAPSSEIQEGDVLNERRGELLALLAGKGIEIGALQSPVIAPHLSVTYVDRYSKEQLLLEYPELKKKEEKLVEVDILADAEKLETIGDDSQDFVIANHVIEHMRDPIGSLLQWQRVLKPGGRLFLAAPDKRFTFDETREMTSLDHLIADFNSPSRERDFDAFQDFAREVSCKKYGLRPVEESEELAKELFEKDYSIHYHVWDFHAFEQFLGYLEEEVSQWQMKTIAHMPTRGKEFIFILEKSVM
jgi:predicted SAM-dependent methyltransferase